MTKKETAKFVIQVIVSIASAILTALGLDKLEMTGNENPHRGAVTPAVRIGVL